MNRSKKITLLLFLSALVLPLCLLVIGLMNWDTTNDNELNIFDASDMPIDFRYDVNYFDLDLKVNKKIELSEESARLSLVSKKNDGRIDFLFPIDCFKNEMSLSEQLDFLKTLGTEDVNGVSDENIDWKVGVAENSNSWIKSEWIVENKGLESAEHKGELVLGQVGDATGLNERFNVHGCAFRILVRYPKESSEKEIFLKREADVFFYLKPKK